MHIDVHVTAKNRIPLYFNVLFGGFFFFTAAGVS